MSYICLHLNTSILRKLQITIITKKEFQLIELYRICSQGDKQILMCLSFRNVYTYVYYIYMNLYV